MGVELKVALVGCGVITQRTLSGLSAILKASRGFISALCDPVEFNRHKVARACGANKVAEYPDLDRLLYESELRCRIHRDANRNALRTRPQSPERRSARLLPQNTGDLGGSL